MAGRTVSVDTDETTAHASHNSRRSKTAARPRSPPPAPPLCQPPPHAHQAFRQIEAMESPAVIDSVQLRDDPCADRRRLRGRTSVRRGANGGVRARRRQRRRHTGSCHPPHLAAVGLRVACPSAFPRPQHLVRRFPGRPRRPARHVGADAYRSGAERALPAWPVQLIVSWGMLDRLRKVFLHDWRIDQATTDRLIEAIGLYARLGPDANGPSLTLGGAGMLPLPDAEDAHVLDTAIAGDADIVATANIRDFLTRARMCSCQTAWRVSGTRRAGC